MGKIDGFLYYHKILESDQPSVKVDTIGSYEWKGDYMAQIKINGIEPLFNKYYTRILRLADKEVTRCLESLMTIEQAEVLRFLPSGPQVEWLSNDKVMIEGANYHYTTLADGFSFLEPWDEYLKRTRVALELAEIRLGGAKITDIGPVTSDSDTPGLGDQVFLNQLDPHTAVLLSAPTTCNHQWKRTPGIYRVYEDCILCGAKKEDTL